MELIGSWIRLPGCGAAQRKGTEGNGGNETGSGGSQTERGKQARESMWNGVVAGAGGSSAQPEHCGMVSCLRRWGVRPRWEKENDRAPARVVSDVRNTWDMRRNR